MATCSLNKCTNAILDSVAHLYTLDIAIYKQPTNKQINQNLYPNVLLCGHHTIIIVYFRNSESADLTYHNKLDIALQVTLSLALAYQCM